VGFSSDLPNQTLSRLLGEEHTQIERCSIPRFQSPCIPASAHLVGECVNMATIEVDFEVYKALTVRRRDENDTYSDVIRRLLGLASLRPDRHKSVTPHQLPISLSHLKLPDGTELRARYKKQVFRASIQSGQIVLESGTRHKSPSSAAVAITHTSVNGWIFWEARPPGETTWKLLKTFKKLPVKVV
jgi:hypothetical protein